MWIVMSVLVVAALGANARTPLIVFEEHSFHPPFQDMDSILAIHFQEYHQQQHYVKPVKHLRTLYQVGESEKELPECEPWSVCSKVDLYDTPWLERQCRCPNQRKCPGLVTANDGHTITDKTRQFKLCEPVKKLPRCRYFRDITWTLTVTGENLTSQVVHCHCPKGSVAYLIRRQPFQARHGSTIGYRYSFACSPQSRLRCQRKEPCRLFTVRKRLELLDEVNTSTLCQCPHGHHCPKHHTHPGVLQGKSYIEENIRTYSGYCVG
ncbi:protein giant-lens [Halyomorpha halys]|uniref:protein giant-lens n=1 Tax=Halyomorpha halys TaxID=286706 RepID=UPI0006D4FF38|nr:protein giant-lens [Halyomorpha halys]